MESQFGAYVKQEKIGCRRFRVLIEQSLFLYVVSARASFSVLFSAGGNFRLLYWGLLKGVFWGKSTKSLQPKWWKRSRVQRKKMREVNKLFVRK